jgi:hypothetical protein
MLQEKKANHQGTKDTKGYLSGKLEAMSLVS